MLKLTILNKLLKTPSGKYSRKSFMIIVSFFVTMLIGLLIVLCDVFFKYEAGQTSKDIFNALLLFVTAQTVNSVVDKKITDKSAETKNEEEL